VVLSTDAAEVLIDIQLRARNLFDPPILLAIPSLLALGAIARAGAPLKVRWRTAPKHRTRSSTDRKTQAHVMI
jgi:hypothetical protein